MTRISKEVLLALGLDPEVELKWLGEADVAPPDVARSCELAPDPEPLDEIYERCPAAFTVVHEVLDWLPQRLPGVEIEVWSLDPRRGFFRSEQPFRAHGAVGKGKRGLEFDTAQSPLACHVGGALIHQAEKPPMQFFEVPQVVAVEPDPEEPSPELQRLLQDAVVRDPPRVGQPPVGEFLSGFEARDWLLREAGQLAAAPAGLLRAAAAGLVARLWSPPAGAKDVVERILAGAATPRQRVLRWFGEQPEDARMALLRAALSAADGLSEQLAALQSFVKEDPDSSTIPGIAWLHERDDLQSVLLLLQSTGQGDELEWSLEALDREAATYHSIWSLVPGLEADDRLSEVSWQEPEHWWGMLGLPD